MRNRKKSWTRGQDQRDLCKEVILRGRKNITTRNDNSDNNKYNAEERDTDVDYLKYVLPAFRCEDDYSADQLTQFDSVADYINVEPISPLVNDLAQLEPEIQLPPLPLECDLFFPQIYGRRQTISEDCSCLLNWLDTKNTLMFDVNEVSKTLDIDPKKLLLILHVLECVQIVTKTEGSRYSWNGRESLGESLKWLKLLAKKERMLEQLCNTGLFQGVIVTNVKAKFTIGSVTQKLLMIYLAAPQPKILTINVVCSVIFGSNNVTAANKVKVTDVINILVATGLFRRVTVRENKKRGNNALAFQFVGRLDEDGHGSYEVEERNTSITRVLEIHEW